MQNAQVGGADVLMSLAPMMLILVPMAFCALFLAPKMGANRFLWFVLFLIPLVNFVAVYVFWFRVAGAILDRLNALTGSMQNAQSIKSVRR